MFRKHQAPGSRMSTVLLILVVIAVFAGSADSRGLKSRAVTADAVNDNLELFCPPDYSTDCPFHIFPEYAGRPTSRGGSPPYDTTFSDVGRECCCVDTFIRVWKVIDAAGAVDTCLQTIVFNDNVPPEIVCPPDVEFECDNVGSFGIATATDNCDPGPTITYTDSVEFQRCPWELWGVRTWIATAKCGNADTCHQRISIQDSQAPVIVYCPPDTVVGCDFRMGELAHAVAIDNCNPNPDVDYEAARLPGQSPCDYWIVRSWEFTDGCCNTVACHQKVTVQDVPDGMSPSDGQSSRPEVLAEAQGAPPSEFGVTCRPNPTDGGTTITYSLPVQAGVSVDIYDVQGRKVLSLADGLRWAGNHTVEWSGKDREGRSVTSGIYFCRLKVNDGPQIFEKIIKM